MRRAASESQVYFFNLYIRYIRSTIWNLVRRPRTGLFYSGTVFLSGYVRDWRYQYGQLLQKLEVSPYSIRISLVFISFVVIMYTTSLNTPISSQTLSLNHHLYADVTQLFLSFHPSEFYSNITHLQNALQQIASWMTANLLTLNSSKTEFILIGLKQQLLSTH